MTTTPDRPEFAITVGGTEIEAIDAADVVEIDVHEEIGRHARCTLLLQNWNPDSRTVRHSDDDLFAPGTAVTVALGYHSDLEVVFEGVVASLTAHFPDRGKPTLRVEARSSSILLEHPPRSRQFAEANDADIASAIASEYGMQATADDGITRAAVVADRVSDWDFLKRRADELGWALYVRGSDLIFRAPAEPADPPVLDARSDLVELHLTEDVTYAIDAAIGSGWDVDAAEPLEAEHGAAAAGLDTGDRDDHEAAISSASWAGRSERRESPSYAAADAADAVAVGRQRASALAHVHGTAVCQGRPAMRCDQWVEITGAGQRLSGPHYVTAARHRLSARGYRTEFRVGKPPTLMPPATPASRTSGVTIGTVAAIDDEAGLNRVRVRLPWRADHGDGVWARLACLDAGDGYGVVFVPQVGQEVVVGFVDADPSVPVVLGQLHNGASAPPIVIDADANAVRAIVTPGGHQVLLDDSDSAAVSILTAGGNEVVLHDGDDEIRLTHGSSGNSLVISADGILLTAAKGDIVMSSKTGAVKFDATQFEGMSSGPAKLQSSATLDVKASGPLGLQGSLVNIN